MPSFTDGEHGTIDPGLYLTIVEPLYKRFEKVLEERDKIYNNSMIEWSRKKSLVYNTVSDLIEQWEIVRRIKGLQGLPPSCPGAWLRLRAETGTL